MNLKQKKNNKRKHSHFLRNPHHNRLYSDPVIKEGIFNGFNGFFNGFLGVYFGEFVETLFDNSVYVQ